VIGSRLSEGAGCRAHYCFTQLRAFWLIELTKNITEKSHWVWCSPYRGRGSTAAFDSAVPPSSSPFEIYKTLYEDVRRGDQHSDKIKANREGLLRGANAKLEKRVIDLATAREIGAVVAAAQVVDFTPLLYVIPYGLVARQAKVVPVERRAHPLSDEYQIESLPRTRFDMIELPL
jgi:hypothetical protein